MIFDMLFFWACTKITYLSPIIRNHSCKCKKVDILLLVIFSGNLCRSIFGGAILSHMMFGVSWDLAPLNGLFYLLESVQIIRFTLGRNHKPNLYPFSKTILRRASNKNAPPQKIGTKTPPWLFVLLTIHPKLSCSNGMHLERKAPYQGENSTKKSLQMPRQLVGVQPFCWYLASTSSTNKIRDDGTSKAPCFLNVPVSKTTKFDSWKSDSVPHVRNILRTSQSSQIWIVGCVTQVGFGSILPEWWDGGKHTIIESLSIITITKLSNM